MGYAFVHKTHFHELHDHIRPVRSCSPPATRTLKAQALPTAPTNCPAIEAKRQNPCWLSLHLQGLSFGFRGNYFENQSHKTSHPNLPRSKRTRYASAQPCAAAVRRAPPHARSPHQRCRLARVPSRAGTAPQECNDRLQVCAPHGLGGVACGA